MSDRTVVGLNPWLPWPLTRWTWWTEPVRAERLAAFRIGVALVLLLDIFGNYWPQATDFFGSNSLGSPEVFVGVKARLWRWSLLRGIEDPQFVYGMLALWAGAGLLLLVGLLPRLGACVAWTFSISIIGLNYYLHNSGDNVRTIALFYLMLCPCGAAWSLQSWWTGRKNPRLRPVYVPAWPVRLLFVQLVLSYFVNGVYKFAGPSWREGDTLHFVMANLAWTRFSFAQFPLPYGLVRLLTWCTLFWELSFPMLIMIPRTRTLALWLGIFFHVGTGVFLQLGPFPLYMMCLYLPLVPWEEYVDSWRQRRIAAKNLA